MKLTAHMMIKNEENWVWFAIMSVLPHIDELIIFDTGSKDKTVELIKLIKKNENKKIRLFKRQAKSRGDLVRLRQEMVELTKTEWFILVDGDEVWSEQAFKKLAKALKKAPKKTIGAVVRTRNCVGDLYHYQPDSAGHYTLKGRKGHLTIRAYRKHPHYCWRGEYPLEGYMDKAGSLLNEQDNRLIFVDTYYYHLTHLKRSNDQNSANVIDRLKKYKYELGIQAAKNDLPEAFLLKRPELVPNPFVSYQWWEYLLALVVTPIKSLKRLR